MAEIPLTQGQVAIVSDEDYEFLSQWNWYVVKIRGPAAGRSMLGSITPIA